MYILGPWKPRKYIFKDNNENANITKQDYKGYIYFFKVNNRNTREGVKYVQS